MGDALSRREPGGPTVDCTPPPRRRGRPSGGPACPRRLPGGWLPRVGGHGQGQPGLAGLAGGSSRRRSGVGRRVRGAVEHSRRAGNVRELGTAMARRRHARVRRAALREGVAAGRKMLDPSQQRLPDELEQMLGSACTAWDQGDSETARANLAGALELALSCVTSDRTRPGFTRRTAPRRIGPSREEPGRCTCDQRVTSAGQRNRNRSAHLGEDTLPKNVTVTTLALLLSEG